MENKYSVVIAEDEELLLDNIVGRVNSLDLGFHVVGRAQTGDGALEEIRLHTPDLLITDIRMPVMDGMKLLTRVTKEFPTVKTIILSGFSDFDYAKKALNLGVSEYLLKPVDREELSTALLQVKTQLDLDRESYASLFDLPPSCTKEQIAETLKEYIRTNYDKNINLDEITSMMNYSAGYLTKIFCRIYGVSPNKYLISLRIHKAQHLLVHNPELAVQQIGELIGYTEISYFSRIFKKYTGISPGTYREEERKKLFSPRNEIFP